MMLNRKSKNNIKKKQKTRKFNKSINEAHYLRPIEHHEHAMPAMTPPSKKDKKGKRFLHEKKKKTKEQKERDEYVEAILAKTSHVMHANSQSYGLKDKNKFHEFNLSTNDRAKDHEKQIKEQNKHKNKSIPISKVFGYEIFVKLFNIFYRY